MKFYEFAPSSKPVLKISQQEQARQSQQQGQTPPTPWPTNVQPTAAPASVKVYPQKWKHEWMEKYLAANMARDAQTVKPTEEDIVRAYMRFADAQRQANQDYENSNNSIKQPSNVTKRF
jgi:hypothetical protein